MRRPGFVSLADDSPHFRGSLHWCALAVVISVFPLIWMGGLVTTKGAGLSVPDWPNSYGYNMFLFPPSKWLGGIFYEHTHRLLGTLSGFLAVTLALMAWGPARRPGRRRWLKISSVVLWILSIAAIGFSLAMVHAGRWTDQAAHDFSHTYVGLASLALVLTIASLCRRRESRRWVRWLAIGELLAVCIQGLLGGLRVDLVNIELAMIHGCFAQLFLCLAAFMALVTSRWWMKTLDRSRLPESRPGRRAMVLAGVCTFIIFCQLIAGAIMRHNGAGLAIPDLPLAYGKLLPPMNQAQLAVANSTRSWVYQMSPVTLAQIWMHFTHRMGALLVTLSVAIFAIDVFRKLPRGRAIRRMAAILGGLVVVQFTLGILTVWLRKPADIASMHVATGALTLMTASLAVAVAARAYARQRPTTLAQPNETERGDSSNLATVHV